MIRRTYVWMADLRDSSSGWDSELTFVVDGVMTLCAEVFSEVGVGSKSNPYLLLVRVLLHVHLGLLVMVLPLLLGIIIVLGPCDLTVLLHGKSVVLVATLCPDHFFKLDFVILAVRKLRRSGTEPGILLLVIWIRASLIMLKPSIAKILRQTSWPLIWKIAVFWAEITLNSRVLSVVWRLAMSLVCISRLRSIAPITDRWGTHNRNVTIAQLIRMRCQLLWSSVCWTLTMDHVLASVLEWVGVARVLFTFVPELLGSLDLLLALLSPFVCV